MDLKRNRDGGESFSGEKEIDYWLNKSGTKKRIMKCLVQSVALYAAETWTLTQTDRRRLKAFEMQIWRRIGKISWLDKVTNEEVLKRVNEDRQILKSIWQRKHRCFGHVLRHNGLLHDITECRIKG